MALGARVAVTSLYVAMALWAAFGRGRSRRERLLQAIAFAGLHAMLVVAWLKAVPPYIDVHVALTEGVRTFLSGHNPYALNYPNMYTEQETLQFYGHGVHGGRADSLRAALPPDQHASLHPRLPAGRCSLRRCDVAHGAGRRPLRSRDNRPGAALLE